MGFEDSTRLPFIERPDLSPFLIHLTKRSDGATAYENLIRILKSGKIKGSTSTGYIKGDTSAACFMDVPLGSLKYVLSKANTKKKTPRYEAYGILVSKAWAYEQGARPVLYLSDKETRKLNVPKSERWRVVRFEGIAENTIGWTHEREWRAKDGFELPGIMLAALVKTALESQRLSREISGQSKLFKARPRSVLPLRIVCQGLPY